MYGEATEAKEHGSNVYIRDMCLVEIDDVEVDEYINDTLFYYLSVYKKYGDKSPFLLLKGDKMLLIKHGEVVRDDEKKVIKDLNDLGKRLQNYEGCTIYINFALLKGYYEVYVEEKKRKFVGYFSNDIKNARALKNYLKENNFKSSEYGIKF